MKYFFQPALERCLAYIAPIAPMPIKPIVGCSSAGSLGEISVRTMMGSMNERIEGRLGIIRRRPGYEGWG
jgi:hypothetical protein